MCQRCKTQNAHISWGEGEVRRLARKIAIMQQAYRNPTNLLAQLEIAKRELAKYKDEPPVECDDLKNGISDKCSLDGCEKRRRSLGLCSMHYERQRRGGKVQ